MSNCNGRCIDKAETYLADALQHIHDHKINRFDELLPWNWTPPGADEKANAA